MSVIGQMENPNALANIIREEAKAPEKIGKEFAKEMAELKEKLKKQAISGEISPEKEGLGKVVAELAEWVSKNRTNELHKFSLAEVEELVKERGLPYEAKVISALANIYKEMETIH